MKLHTLTSTSILALGISLSACTQDKPPLGTTNEQPAISAQTNNADSKLLGELTSISPASGQQLPSATGDSSQWKSVGISNATMLVPPDWKTITDFGEQAGSRIHTIGAVNAREDLYVELRVLEDSDSAYMQTVMDHVKSDYTQSKGRLAEKTILGFQPMVKDGIAGKIEIMNEYGKAKNEDGSPTWRIILWDGRWQQGDRIDKAELTARFAQDKYDEFAPIVSRIISTVAIKK